MKIITRCSWEWRDDELVKIEEESYEYNGPLALAMGGGGGNDGDSEELRNLYTFQKEQGEYLMGLFKGTTAPMYQNWAKEAQGYGSIANQEAEAAKAQAGAQTQFAGAKQQLINELNSTGAVPDQKNTDWMNKMIGIDVAGAGQTAAAGTQARENVRNKSFAMQQDVVGMGMGTPTQATQAANSATAAANWNLQNQQQARNDEANSVANVARGFVNVWGNYQHAREGGLIQRKAQGGLMRPLQLPPMQGRSGGGGGGQVPIVPYAPGLGRGLAKATEGAGNMTGSPGMSAFGRGMQLDPAQAQAAADVYKQAALNVESQLPAAVPEATSNAITASQYGTLAGSEQSALLAAQDVGLNAATDASLAATAAPTAEALGAAATGLETAGALGTAGAAVGTALPWVGLGLGTYALGKNQGWWADGGQVTPGSNGASGGDVEGPGGPKDDLVPAMLSDGEYVMPVGAVRFFGLDKLDKMRQKGLEYEKQMGIGRSK